jgi:hypothetical protein
MKRIDELTRSDIVKGVDSKTIERSKLVKSARYLGITKDYIIRLEVPSVTANPPTKYRVDVKLLSYPDLENDEDLTIKEKVRLALLDGDVAISCTCPAFKWWGFQYIMTQLGSHAGLDQNIYPKVRNPRLEGSLCKHSLVAVKLVGTSWLRIVSDIKNNKFIR